MDGRKRRQDGSAPNSNGGFKKHKQEMDSSGVGSKSKPCTKFFSTSGCPFGESCHFLHHVPGGYNAVAQMMNLTPMAKAAPPPMQAPNGSAPVKTRICKRFTSGDGCKFGDQCHFAHGEWELNKPVAPSFEDHHHAMGPPIHARYGVRNDPLGHRGGFAGGFGDSEEASVKIGVDSSLVGAIIGKSGANSKQISRVTGVKLSIRDHESNPNLKNIELQGSFDQLKIASAMVRDLIANVGSGGPAKGHGQGHGQGQGQGQGRGGGGTPAYGPASNNYKTKICENFTKGTCTFSDKCHFAHGAEELRKSAV